MDKPTEPLELLMAAGPMLTAWEAYVKSLEDGQAEIPDLKAANARLSALFDIACEEVAHHSQYTPEVIRRQYEETYDRDHLTDQS